MDQKTSLFYRIFAWVQDHAATVFLGWVLILFFLYILTRWKEGFSMLAVPVIVLLTIVAAVLAAMIVVGFIMRFLRR